MENLHGNSRAPKLSPQHLIKGGSFENADLDSPLLRYLRGGSQSPVDTFKQRYYPLSPVENLMAAAARSPPSYRSPREEVLVIDGVSVTGGKRSSRSGGSGSSSSASSESSGKSLHRGQFCLETLPNFLPVCTWKRNLRPTRFPGKNKSELCKSSPRSGSCTPSPKSHLVYQIMASAVTEAAAAASSPKLKRTNKIPITAICHRDWSPQDDDIEVVLPSSTEKPSSRADVDAYITVSLYGPTRKRLQVFAEICE